MLFDEIENLTDLEIAILLCLVAREHCIVEADKAAIDDLENELKLVISSHALAQHWLTDASQIIHNIFGLPHVVLHCSPETSLEEFSTSILTHESVDQDDEGRLQSSRSSNIDTLKVRLYFHSIFSFVTETCSIIAPSLGHKIANFFPEAPGTLHFS